MLVTRGGVWEGAEGRGRGLMVLRGGLTAWRGGCGGGRVVAAGAEGPPGAVWPEASASRKAARRSRMPILMLSLRLKSLPLTRAFLEDDGGSSF